VLHDRRAARQNVGVGLHQRVGVLALQPVVQRRVAVQVVEVLEQAEAVDLREVRIVLELAVRRLYEISPGEHLFVEWRSLRFEQVERHEQASKRCMPTRRTSFGLAGKRCLA
jgi:hypothetical protein